MSTSCYQINRSPSSTINFRTPEQLWSGKLPSLDHLRPFGCIAYIYKKEGKLDPRAKKVVFLGYPQGVKGYKIWLIDDKKIVINWDVVFKETKYYMPNKVKNVKADQTKFF